MMAPLLWFWLIRSLLKTRISLKNLEILGAVGVVGSLLLGGFSGSGQAQEQQSVSRWIEANRAYEEQRFSQAVILYESLLEAGYHNGHLYYNLGNAYFRLDDLGKSIGYYLQATQYLPRHEDLRANLKYARQQTKDRRETPQQSWRAIFQEWSNYLTLQEWFLLLLMANTVFWGGALARLFYQREILSWLLFLSGGLAFFFFAGVLIKWWTPLPIGTILPQKSAIYSAPHPQSTVLFQLHAGTEVIIEEEVDPWIKIQYEPTKKGWIEKTHLFPVYPVGI